MMLKVVGTLNIILAVLIGLFLVLTAFVYPTMMERLTPGLARIFMTTLMLAYGGSGLLAPIYNGVFAWREKGERVQLPLLLHLSNGLFLFASVIFILAGVSIWALKAAGEFFDFYVFFFFVVLFVIVGSGYLLLLRRRAPSASPTP